LTDVVCVVYVFTLLEPPEIDLINIPFFNLFNNSTFSSYFPEKLDIPFNAAIFFLFFKEESTLILSRARVIDSSVFDHFG